MTQRDDIERMADVAAMQFRAAAMAFRAASAAEQSVAASFQKLEADRVEARTKADPADPAAMRMLEHWQVWARQELARGAVRQAADRAAMLRAKDAATRAHARHVAAQALLAKVKAEMRRRGETRYHTQLLELATLDRVKG